MNHESSSAPPVGPRNDLPQLPAIVPLPPVLPTRDAEEFPLHPAAVKLWTWQGAIFAAAIALPGLVVPIFVGPWWIAVLTLLVSTLLALSLRAYSRAYFRSFHCVLSDDGLMLLRGVWWRNEIFVPANRIQHTEVKQGPLARRLGMATLQVFTAGTHLGQIDVSGLPYEAAVRLRDRILGRDGTDAL